MIFMDGGQEKQPNGKHKRRLIGASHERWRERKKEEEIDYAGQMFKNDSSDFCMLLSNFTFFGQSQRSYGKGLEWG